MKHEPGIFKQLIIGWQRIAIQIENDSQRVQIQKTSQNITCRS